jgi:hypothetical protein
VRSRLLCRHGRPDSDLSRCTCARRLRTPGALPSIASVVSRLLGPRRRTCRFWRVARSDLLKHVIRISLSLVRGTKLIRCFAAQIAHRAQSLATQCDDAAGQWLQATLRQEVFTHRELIGSSLAGPGIKTTYGPDSRRVPDVRPCSCSPPVIPHAIEGADGPDAVARARGVAGHVAATLSSARRPSARRNVRSLRFAVPSS